MPCRKTAATTRGGLEETVSAQRGRKPRVHLQTYHGVLAPSASWRDDVVKSRVSPQRPGDASKEKNRRSARRPAHLYLWPELMRRVFGFEVLRCKVCRAKRRLISMITERSTIVRILAHLGLETAPSQCTSALLARHSTAVA